MARPKQEQPTPAELEILKVLWEQGPLPVRDVMEVLNRTPPERAYTTVMSLMNIMTEKGLLKRTPQGRAFVYAAKAGRDKTLGNMVNDLLGRAFAGSASALVALGYKPQQASQIVTKVAVEGMSVEAIIRESLRSLV